MILLFSRYLEEALHREAGIRDFEVRVRSEVSLSGRPYQLMIDPARDLTQVRRSVFPAACILPLETPLRGILSGEGSSDDEDGGDVDA